MIKWPPRTGLEKRDISKRSHGPRRSGKILEIRNPLAFPHLRYPVTRFRLARTACPPANEPTSVGLPDHGGPDDAKMGGLGLQSPRM